MGNLDKIDRYFASDRLEDILDALDAGAEEGDEWAATEAATIRKKSPIACKVSLKLLDESPYQLHFVDEMRMEYGVMVRLIHHPDFKEGVRALLIDKDNKPNWHPTNPARDRRRRGRRILRAAAARRAMAAVRFLGARMSYETILVEKRGAVTLVTLNRPQALNALKSTVLKELIAAFAAYDADDSQRCLVLTGSEKAFAAGADIKEMQAQGFADMYSTNFFAGWEQVTATRKPWIAAVAGFALGGGCEVAMMADFIIAADTAKFGQPEIKLGVTPGMGGSQRLTRAVGKAKAMEMCLTGRMMDAAEAERSGLVARVVPAADLVDEAIKTAEAIAAMAPLAAIANKEMVNAAFEMRLAQGIRFERRLFHGLFGTEDQKEGMTAFVEKRPGNWKGTLRS